LDKKKRRSIHKMISNPSLTRRVRRENSMKSPTLMLMKCPKRSSLRRLNSLLNPQVKVALIQRIVSQKVSQI